MMWGAGRPVSKGSIRLSAMQRTGKGTPGRGPSRGLGAVGNCLPSSKSRAGPALWKHPEWEGDDKTQD